MSQHPKNLERYQATRKVTLVGAIVNIVLAMVQIVGGFLAQSQALIADGFHTISDLVTDFVVLIAAKMASKDADEDHPYGHERIETIATIILGLALAGVAIGIALDAANRLQNPDTLLQPGLLAIAFAAFGIVCKEGLYRYTYRIGKQINSTLLKANAAHHRSDAISSVMVLLGVTASVVFSIPWLDILAALAVSVMIFYMGAKLILDSIMELVDTAWESEKVEAMLLLIGDVPGVQNAHMLRTRKMSSNVLVDVHIQVAPTISVSEGHHIAEQVMSQLKDEYDEVSDIMVHIDPEDDETATPSKHLADRNALMELINPILEAHGISEMVENIVIHYLDGSIELEIVVNDFPDHSTASSFKQQLTQLSGIKKIDLLQKI